MTHDRWTEEELALLKKLQEGGYSYARIGAKLGRSAASIRSRVRHYRLPRNKPRISGSSAYIYFEYKRQEMLELYQQGVPWAQIVKKFELSREIAEVAARWVGVKSAQKRIEEKLFSEIPKDTRGLTARLCGDPLPGRSALDRRQYGTA